MNNPTPNPLRTTEELQRAHDVLDSLLTKDELFDLFNRSAVGKECTQPTAVMALDVLCWALGHSNQDFQAHLDELEAGMRAQGFEPITEACEVIGDPMLQGKTR